MDFFAQNYDFVSLTSLTLNGSRGNIESKSNALLHVVRLKNLKLFHHPLDKNLKVTPSLPFHNQFYPIHVLSYH